MAINADPTTLYVGEALTCRAALGGRVVSFESRVRYVDAAGLYLDRPSGIAGDMDAGEEILVRYMRGDAIYQFLTVVKPTPPIPIQDEWEEGEPEPIVTILRGNPLVLRFPTRITRFQRRSSDRRALSGIVQVRRAEGDTRDWRGYLLDLSIGGVRFATKQAGFLIEGRSPIGQRVSVTVLISKGIELPALTAKIRRVTIDKDSDQDDYLMVQAAFHNMPAKVRAKLTAWLERQQRRGS